MPSLASYQSFVNHVTRLLEEPVTPGWHGRADAACNGQAGNELTKVVDISQRRALGTFFTGHTMADLLLKDISLLRSDVVFDPACGAGDLLLAAARRLPKGESLDTTLEQWQRSLRGTDVVSEFLEACNRRLHLAARVVFPESETPIRDVGFLLDQQDALVTSLHFAEATYVIMNPPFMLQKVPSDCSWASGKANCAALFVDAALHKMKKGSSLLAILPEVLRTGTRYVKWRETLRHRASVEREESAGIFSSNADIDVFFLHLVRKGANNASRKALPEKQDTKQVGPVLADFFNVCIGPVVDYRDPHTGPARRFAHARNVKPWTTVCILKGPRKWIGRMEKPPFVVVRRTSRPGDKWRATASAISGNTPVAVENHLVICRPKAGGLRACKRLLKALKAQEVNHFLDQEMRCRHLTVGVVRSIPLPAGWAADDAT